MSTDTLEPTAAANKIGPLQVEVIPSDPSPDDIRRRAYELYLERGGGHGQDVEDWLQAKNEITRAATPTITTA